MAALTRPILDGREMPVSPIVAASPRGSTSRHLAGSGWAAARIRVVGPDGHRHAGDTIPIHVIETDVSSGLTSSRAACLFTAGRGVGQQRHLAGVLHRDRDVALMLTAVPADPARPNLAPVGEKLTQQASVLNRSVDLCPRKTRKSSSCTREVLALPWVSRSPTDRGGPCGCREPGHRR
jgi:hypothetical protein